MIELCNVTIPMGQRALNELSLTVGPGEYCVLMGKTGEGKSSILEAICGLKPITKGRILLQGVDVTGWTPSDRVIGYVPQDLALFENLNVKEHFEFALKLRKWSRREIALRVEELSDALGISHLLERTVHRLSGGESQRVALGRALSFYPAVLLLDEPWSALDESTRGELQQWMKRVKAKTPITTLHVTHNRDEAIALADTCLSLSEGHILPCKLGGAE